jgi:hypothetical protein
MLRGTEVNAAFRLRDHADHATTGYTELTPPITRRRRGGEQQRDDGSAIMGCPSGVEGRQLDGRRRRHRDADHRQFADLRASIQGRAKPARAWQQV